MIKNLFLVLIGSLSFVSYCESEGVDTSLLPKIKKGIFSPVSLLKKSEFTSALAERLNVMYAKDYRLMQDINIILKSWKRPDQN